VTSQQQCIGAGDATVRNNTHGTIQIVSGTGAFAQIGSANKFLKVPAGVPLNGTVTLRALNNGPGFAVAPLIETLSWGTPQTSWGGIANLSPGESTFNSQINSRAPLEVGTYQILFAFQLEKTGANVASGTSWARGQDVWGDGNEIARFDALQIQEGQKFGCTIDPWLTQEGFQLFYVPADAITIEVGPPPAAPVQPSEINFRYVEDNPQNIDIHQVDFRNFSYQSDCSKQMGDGSNPVIRVSNGKWQKGNPVEGNMISFSIARMMYGKLNGNGGEQVVVMTSCQGMSNFDYEEVFIFEMSSGIPKILAKLSPSDWGHGEQCSGANCQIRELHVSNQQLSLSFGVGGSSAQPAWLDTASFQWSANKFIRKGVTRKVLRGVN
jgi:hypothetical protein